jgi:hypothetical protein
LDPGDEKSGGAATGSGTHVSVRGASAIFSRVRKWTWLALAIVVAFVGGTFLDDCSLESGESCPPACHFSCLDGCSIGPVEPAIQAPVATQASRLPQVELASSPLELDFPPELIPPRA